MTYKHKTFNIKRALYIILF